MQEEAISVPCKNLPRKTAKLYFAMRERLSITNNNQGNDKFVPKSVMNFQTWRIGTLFFLLETASTSCPLHMLHRMSEGRLPVLVYYKAIDLSICIINVHIW